MNDKFLASSVAADLQTVLQLMTNLSKKTWTGLVLASNWTPAYDPQNEYAKWYDFKAGNFGAQDKAVHKPCPSSIKVAPIFVDNEDDSDLDYECSNILNNIELTIRLDTSVKKLWKEAADADAKCRVAQQRIQTIVAQLKDADNLTRTVQAELTRNAIDQNPEMQKSIRTIFQNLNLPAQLTG